MSLRPLLYIVQTPLCLAVITNQPKLVERLLQLGSDVNVQIIRERAGLLPSRREQPLHIAASRGLQSLNTLAALLCCQQLDIDATDSEGLLQGLK